jgi:hypothetical protein
LARFRARASQPELATHHREAAEMIRGDDELGEMYDRLDRLLKARPRARIISTTCGDVEAAYDSMLAAVADRP